MHHDRKDHLPGPTGDRARLLPLLHPKVRWNQAGLRWHQGKKLQERKGHQLQRIRQRSTQGLDYWKLQRCGGLVWDIWNLHNFSWNNADLNLCKSFAKIVCASCLCSQKDIIIKLPRLTQFFMFIYNTALVNTSSYKNDSFFAYSFIRFFLHKAILAC